MPIYVYWGEDNFALTQAVKVLQARSLDPDWASFNLDKITPDQPDSVMQGLNQAMTSPFGSGDRFVWLVDTPLMQRCSEELLAELDRTLPMLRSNSRVFSHSTLEDRFAASTGAKSLPRPGGEAIEQWSRIYRRSRWQ
jgi:DNA polymerase III subunit delta